MKNSGHWFHKALFTVYVAAILWTSFTRAAEYKVVKSTIPPAAPSLRAVPAPRGRLHVEVYVHGAANAAGVDPRVAEWIVSHESGRRPEATGDGGESRGLWQINRAWHPEVSDACAYDVTCSTNWSLERIRAGHVEEWSTWRYCRARFEDCPF